MVSLIPLIFTALALFLLLRLLIFRQPRLGGLRCGRCGRDCERGANFCPRCGNKLRPE